MTTKLHTKLSNHDQITFCDNHIICLLLFASIYSLNCILLLCVYSIFRLSWVKKRNNSIIIVHVGVDVVVAFCYWCVAETNEAKHNNSWNNGITFEFYVKYFKVLINRHKFWITSIRCMKRKWPLIWNKHNGKIIPLQLLYIEKFKMRNFSSWVYFTKIFKNEFNMLNLYMFLNVEY